MEAGNVSTAPPPAARGGRANTVARLRSVPELMTLAFLVLLCVAMAIAEPRFATEINLRNVGQQSSVLVILSIGLLFVLLIGGIDLSLAGLIGLSSVVAAKLAGSVPLELAFLLTIAAAALVGLINGLLVSAGKLAPIVVTLGTGQVMLGVALLMTTGGPIRPADHAYADLASTRIAGVPLPVLIAAACAVFAYVLLKRLRFGRYVYAVGGNETAAWLAGVPTLLVKVGGYALCSLFGGIAGVVLSSRVVSGDASLGSTEMLSAYAAVFIGGVGFGTGRGNVSGVVFGALILGVISNGINLLGLDTQYQYVIGGALIVLAIAFQRILGTEQQPR